VWLINIQYIVLMSLVSEWGTCLVPAGHNEADSLSTKSRKRQKRTKTDIGKHYLCRTTLDILNDLSFRAQVEVVDSIPSKIWMVANLGVITRALETTHGWRNLGSDRLPVRHPAKTLRERKRKEVLIPLSFQKEGRRIALVSVRTSNLRMNTDF
jgi:hypothetical protein